MGDAVRFLGERRTRTEPDEQRAEREHPKPEQGHLRASQRVRHARVGLGWGAAHTVSEPDVQGGSIRAGSNRCAATVLYRRSPCLVDTRALRPHRPRMDEASWTRIAVVAPAAVAIALTVSLSHHRAPRITRVCAPQRWSRSSVSTRRSFAETHLLHGRTQHAVDERTGESAEGNRDRPRGWMMSGAREQARMPVGR